MPTLRKTFDSNIVGWALPTFDSRGFRVDRALVVVTKIVCLNEYRFNRICAESSQRGLEKLQEQEGHALKEYEPQGEVEARLWE